MCQPVICIVVFLVHHDRRHRHANLYLPFSIQVPEWLSTSFALVASCRWNQTCQILPMCVSDRASWWNLQRFMTPSCAGIPQMSENQVRCVRRFSSRTLRASIVPVRPPCHLGCRRWNRLPSAHQVLPALRPSTNTAPPRFLKVMIVKSFLHVRRKSQVLDSRHEFRRDSWAISWSSPSCEGPLVAPRRSPGALSHGRTTLKFQTQRWSSTRLLAWTCRSLSNSKSVVKWWGCCKRVRDRFVRFHFRSTLLKCLVPFVFQPILTRCRYPVSIEFLTHRPPFLTSNSSSSRTSLARPFRTSSKSSFSPVLDS